MDSSGGPYWEDGKVLHDGNHPIDPSFGDAQSQHAAADVVAAAAVASAPGRNQPSDATSEQELVNRQGRPLTQTKRAAQNRAAQRAFRARKDIYIKDLENKVSELKQSKETIDSLRQEIIQLRDYILVLQSRLIEHPNGVPVPTPPAVYQRRPELHYDDPEKKR